MPEAPQQRGAGGARRPRTAQERASARRRRRNRRLGVLAAVVAIVVVGLGAAIAVSRDGGGAPGSVQVAGVDVDGKDRAEIARIVRQRATELAAEQIVVTRA